MKIMKGKEREEIPPKNIIEENILRIIIEQYSARKIKANQPPMYSVLNPETNSDSPSAKSKGLRFVSAKQEENQIENKIKFPKKNQSSFWERVNFCKWQEEVKIARNKIIRKNETS